MEYSLSHTHPNTLSFLPRTLIAKRPHTFRSIAPHNSPNFAHRTTIPSSPPPPTNNTTLRLRRSNHVVAAAGASHCESGSSLNAPLEPRSEAGRFLSSVLLNQRQFFRFAAGDELKHLADDRDAALNRMLLSTGSDEECLHRRIAQLKESDCQAAVEDVIYMLIFYKFSEIRVPLVPRLSRCVYNGRLEIWPSKDFELESIHSIEILEMVREHVSTVIGLRANSSVADYWARTQIHQFQLGQVYVASILYGYFLKSASLRHNLEQCLTLAHQDFHLTHRTSIQLPDLWTPRPNTLAFGCVRNVQSLPLVQGSSKQEPSESLRSYIMGFDSEALQICAKPKSKEVLNLIEKHSCALFGDQNVGMLDANEVISTSFLSMKRLVLEAVAFGSFLWDVEEYVDTVYKLKDNSEAVSK